jgi:hypothetical protein
VIANVDETLDDKESTETDRVGAVEAVVGLFSAQSHNNAFLPRYLPLLQASSTILHEHGRVAQILRTVESK